ncbi:hypothetical protein D5H75_01785 [Bailinhaonella thermotolerans]|uniref:Uncharacterized protein n=1 Tax=Bailinhaonella thermotolerans TaxID=1070861 RepID=A0A3A4BAE5_9ACTN|nr:hypothetical protein D5H75_01785 [Bailinhaonella thermotolerans]
MAVLGLFLGLIAGALLTSAIARPLVGGGGGEISTGVGVLLGMLMPVLGISGAVIGVIIERRSRGGS